MKLTGVIVDWAGTIVDHGSCAPIAAIQHVFSSAGVPVTEEEARQPMGLAKRAHIERLLAIPRIKEEWARIRGHAPSEQDLDELYAGFVPAQLKVLPAYSELVDGVAEAAARMRARGLKIGATTGYNRAMLDYLIGRARDQGFLADFAACPDDVPSGRPAPFMCYLNALKMAVQPMWTLVKIGDTPVDIEEGRNAGMWTIAITRTGNEVGRSPGAWEATSEQERIQLLACAHDRLMNAGAHYVAESCADCDEILDRIETRLKLGDYP
jgi:phosphonoacetaldehyde hydrolase